MKYGLLNSQTGEIILPPIYVSIEGISDNRIILTKDSLTGLMNAKTLKYFLEPIYRKIEPLKNGNYIVTKTDTLYFLNSSFQPINKFTNLKRFEPTLSDCIYIFRATDYEGLSDCDGNKFSQPNWKEVLEIKKGFVFVKTTNQTLVVYNISSRKKILDRPYQNYRLKENGIVVYHNNITTLYDYSGKEIR